MIKLLFLGFIFFPLFSFSSVVVEKVKGNKAIVTFDSSTPLKTGDHLNTGSDSDDDDEDDEESSSSKKRRRLHGLSLESSYTTSEVTSGNTKTSGSSFDFTGSYNYNFGQFELSLGVVLSTTESAGSKAVSTFLIPGAEYNFIKNKSGNNFIPYVGFSLYTGSFELTTGSTKDPATRLGFVASGGIKYFPFSDSFSISGSINYSDFTDKYSNSTNTENKHRYTSLATGWTVYF